MKAGGKLVENLEELPLLFLILKKHLPGAGAQPVLADAELCADRHNILFGDCRALLLHIADGVLLQPNLFGKLFLAQAEGLS